MKDRRCVVIGGGAVAERKVEGLVAVGANVTVIAPGITDGLKQLLKQGAIRHVAREYQAGDRAGYDLVFVATDDSEVNALVSNEARSLHIWVNSADDPDHCDFILPAVIRRGNLAVAVATDGMSPAVTRAIREELDQYFTADYASFVQIAGEVRRELREKSVSPGGERMESGVEGGLPSLDQRGKTGAGERASTANFRSKIMRTGKVYLVGAGPGDPGLITVRGLQLLHNAQVIVYDQLVSPALLEEASACGHQDLCRQAGGSTLHRSGRNQPCTHRPRAPRQ